MAFKKGDVYVCNDTECEIEVTISKGCTEKSCPTCGPLICCEKPMVKKR